MRTLVEQTQGLVRGWLANLDLAGRDGVRVGVLMGGEPAAEDWRVDLAHDAVIIGTLDMILSRALNRGYGESRYAWPIDFGLLNNDCAYVLDEVQLMGAARATSRQLQAFRTRWGTTAPVTSTWMSATLDPLLLHTVDAPVTDEPFALGDDEAAPSLRSRLSAERTIHRWLPDRESAGRGAAGDRAAAVVREHRAGTLTLAVVNTIEAARDLFVEVGKLAPDAELCLLHSRFRPPDRAALLDRVLSQPPPGGRIVCSTQVIEAGVDLSAATLFTEAAPWSSIVQRIGRCNRDGGTPDARVFWDDPARPEPYPAEDVRAAHDQLARLTGTAVTTDSLAALEVFESGGEESQVVRRADLLRLFDTAADVGGNDIDVSPFIRDGQDLDVQLCWRTGVAAAPDAQDAPQRDELCPVSLAELGRWRTSKALYRLDHLARRRDRWAPVAAGERVVPGQILLVEVSAGGYTTQQGWTPTSKATVDPIVSAPAALDPAPDDERLTDDAATTAGTWVTLSTHLDDVGAEVAALLDDLGYDLPGHVVQTVIAAGRWHDWGKAHQVFQQRLQHADGSVDAGAGCPDAAELWAKSATGKGGRGGVVDRRYFRHELASALAVLTATDEVLGAGVDRSLAAYLVAAHHGKVRMSIRSAPDETGPEDGRRYALGVWDGDELPAVGAGDMQAPAVRLDLGPMDIGGTDDAPSWVARAADLVAREDLGPFRLGLFEAVVRIADWRASARYARPEGAR